MCTERLLTTFIRGTLRLLATAMPAAALSLRCLLTAALLLASSHLMAQDIAPVPMVTAPASWEEVWHEVMSAEEQDEDTWQETFEVLQQLARQPLNLNSCTRDDLEQLPFLSSQQVMDILEYVDRYGPVRSLSELRMVYSLDYQQVQLLPFFVFVGTVTESPDTLPSLQTMAKAARHRVTGTLRVPFYQRKGDINGYLGYPYRHEIRYEMDYRQQVRAGFIGAQDAGEPFFAHRNGWGYDYYSAYVQLRQWGCMETLVAGRYKMSAGMGLVLGSGFSMGKLATLQSMGRRKSGLRPHTSRSESGYLQGAGATLRLSRSIELTAFASLRPIDATLSGDTAIRTITTTGYHRTPTEMERKHNAHETDGGMHLSWRKGRWNAALTATYTHLSLPLRPDTTAIYRRYQPEGRHFSNASASYGFTHHLLSLQGETATDDHGHIATLNALGIRADESLRLLLLQRFYSYRYQALHAHSLSEGGHIQNESGWMMGATWHPLRHWQVQGYADYSYFAWPRYGVKGSSEAFDVLLSALYEHRQWTLATRYRWHRRQHDTTTDDGTKQLTWQTDHRARMALTWTAPVHWRLTTQCDAAHNSDGSGWMASERLAWQRKGLSVNATAAYFDTRSPSVRLYLYDRQPAYSFGFDSYADQGIRLACMAQAKMNRHWQLAARIGCTRYFNRSTIGSGLQLIDHAATTDMDLQAQYKF